MNINILNGVFGILKKDSELLYNAIKDVRSKFNIKRVIPDSPGPKREMNKKNNEIKNRKNFLLRKNGIKNRTS